jgi:hypothetical protein
LKKSLSEKKVFEGMKSLEYKNMMLHGKGYDGRLLTGEGLTYRNVENAMSMLRVHYAVLNFSFW